MNALTRLNRQEVGEILFGRHSDGPDGELVDLREHLSPLKFENELSFDSGGSPQPFDHGFRLQLDALMTTVPERASIQKELVTVADGREFRMWSFIPAMARMVRRAKAAQIRLVPFAGRTSSGPYKNPKNTDHGTASAGITVDFINDVNDLAKLIDPEEISSKSLMIPMGLSAAVLERFLEAFHNKDNKELGRKGTRIGTGFDITTYDSSQLIANFITNARGDKRKGLRVSAIIMIDKDGQIHYIDDKDEIRLIRGSQKPGLIVGLQLDLEELPTHEEAVTMGIPGELTEEDSWLNEWPEDLLVHQKLDPDSEDRQFDISELTEEEVTYLFRVPEIYARLWPWMYDRSLPKSEGDHRVHLTGLEILARSGVGLFAGKKVDGEWTYKKTLKTMDDKARWVMSQWLEADPLMLVMMLASTHEEGASGIEGNGFAEALVMMEEDGVIRADSSMTSMSDGYVEVNEGVRFSTKPYQALKDVRVEVPTQWRKLARKTRLELGDEVKEHSSQSLDNDSLLHLHDVNELIELARKEILQRAQVDFYQEEVSEEEAITAEEKKKLVNFRNNLRRAARLAMVSKVILMRKARRAGMSTLENGHLKGVVSEDAKEEDGGLSIHARLVGTPEQGDAIIHLIAEADDYDKNVLDGATFGEHVSIKYDAGGEKNHEYKWEGQEAVEVRKTREKYTGGRNDTFGFRSEHNPHNESANTGRPCNGEMAAK